MLLTAEEFIRRFVQHVLPRGFQKVQHYGFAHPRSKIDLVVATCPYCGGVLSRVAASAGNAGH